VFLRLKLPADCCSSRKPEVHVKPGRIEIWSILTQVPTKRLDIFRADDIRNRHEIVQTLVVVKMSAFERVTWLLFFGAKKIRFLSH